MLQVVAAILEREGRVLVCQRRPDQSHPLKWEFPGGKVEAGESPEQALARELEEELGIRGAEGREMARYEFAYPGKAPILLRFLRVTAYAGGLQNRIFHDMQWVARERLGEIDILEGDREFLQLFAGAGAGSSGESSAL